MEFTSVLFIEIFLPAVLLLYYLAGVIVKNKEACMNVRNVMLLVVSLAFYAMGGFKSLGLFACIILANYGLGLLTQKFRDGGAGKKAKAVTALSVVIDALILAFFKYFNMIGGIGKIFSDGGNIGSSLAHFTGTSTDAVVRIVMPLAISFIVFQVISYQVDVYKGKVKAEKNILHFALYMALFMQITQGPIMRYDNLGNQIKERTHSTEKVVKGFERFAFGLGKKVLIANVVAATADSIWGVENIRSLSSGIAWLGILLYTLQIYFDFSGYTDMAIGIGLMFGFAIDENFNYPYTSLSIQEFWRRWHISLSTWFKDYIYIPLGGNRCSKGRLFFNLFMVFFVTGIWHGANLTFILWGILFAVFSIIERAFLGDLLKKNPVKPVNWIYTIFVVMMGWVLFRAPSLAAAGDYYSVLFSFRASPEGLTILSYISMELIIAVFAGILLTGLLQRPLTGVKKKLEEKLPFKIVVLVFCLAIFAWALVQLVGGSYNPSIYGNF